MFRRICSEKGEIDALKVVYFGAPAPPNSHFSAPQNGGELCKTAADLRKIAVNLRKTAVTLDYA